MRLKQRTSWNQLEADWRRLLALEPDGCFVAEADGVGVGTAGACMFGPIAWIAMVLVDAERRKHGIGTALMKHTLAYVDGRDVRSVRLDATPLGQPIYEKLGFVAEYTLARYEGTLPAAITNAPTEQVSAADLAQLSALDRRVTATERSKLIERLFGERPGAA